MLQKDKWSTQTHRDLYAEQHDFHSLKTCLNCTTRYCGFPIAYAQFTILGDIKWDS